MTRLEDAQAFFDESLSGSVLQTRIAFWEFVAAFGGWVAGSGERNASRCRVERAKAVRELIGGKR